ncbi:hypothetical protein SDC9_105458 [bioreactor metagenome]|uniref:Uncharacterized protein n=1 Tax=bioreactor metagenome TaxID=1076179 RepID=A0A645B0Q3_9ZZZZ
MRAKELVVPRDKIERFRQQHRAGIDIVQPRGVVAHKNVWPLTLTRVIFDLGVDAKLLKIQEPPKVTEYTVNQLRRLFDLS